MIKKTYWDILGYLSIVLIAILVYKEGAISSPTRH